MPTGIRVAVFMADGSSKPIADVVVGDEVLAFNPETEAAEPRRVTDTFVHEQVATIEVTTSAGVVTTTVNHPFYAEGRGWIPAGDLHQGDQLRSPDGSLVEVVSIQATGRSETVHNLAVDGLHNYHVQTEQGQALLVHNDGACFDDDQQAVLQLAKEAKRSATAGAPITRAEGETLAGWAKEYGIPRSHPPMMHSDARPTSWAGQHLHIDINGQHIEVLE